ncbi:MAG TPA: cupredoxin domain-containing protein [Nocardioides sp.]|nr:cupredoxin domain-containing protein [Nocardioides sp.]
MTRTRPVAPVVAAIAAGSLLSLAPPSSALVNPAVTIAGMAFAPARLTVPMGTTVTWTNEDATAHTATSDDGFFDTGSISASGGTAEVTFRFSGRYRYHCSIHSTMHGQVVIPLEVVSGSATDGWKLRWASIPGPAGISYDVQYKRASASEWRTLRNDTLRPTGKFDPSRSGDYVVRSRTNNAAADDKSGWTPKVGLTIS